jgi:hypothetical protein
MDQTLIMMVLVFFTAGEPAAVLVSSLLVVAQDHVSHVDILLSLFLCFCATAIVLGVVGSTHNLFNQRIALLRRSKELEVEKYGRAPSELDGAVRVLQRCRRPAPTDWRNTSTITQIITYLNLSRTALVVNAVLRFQIIHIAHCPMHTARRS